jgi:lipopolysaccharide export system permease protein
MKTVRRLLYLEILQAVAFASLAFLALFFFIDFVDELDEIGHRGWTLLDALWSCALAIPGHFYELFPITVLIGTIYALARLAQSSEFTILRTAGLGPGRALMLLTVLGLAFSALTFVVGDIVAPTSDQMSTLLRARANGGIGLARGGAWLRDGGHGGEPGGAPARRFSVNVGASDGEEYRAVRIFEFGPRGELLSRTEAERGRVDDEGVWTLDDVTRMDWQEGPDGRTLTREEHLDRTTWASGLTRRVVAAAILPLKTMSTWSLYTYMSHLASHDQAAQRYQIQFWKKALYPFACLVMMGLALPFAYLHARAGGVSLKVFGGVMLGIGFVLLNNMAGHLGLLREWTPWIAASVPSLLFLFLSLAAFSWLVRYR